MAHLIARFAAKSRELLELVQKKRQRRNDDLENEIRIARARRAEMLGDSSRGAGRKVASLCARLRGRQGAAATGQIAIPAAGPNRTPRDVSPDFPPKTPIAAFYLFLRVCVSLCQGSSSLVPRFGGINGGQKLQVWYNE